MLQSDPVRIASAIKDNKTLNMLDLILLDATEDKGKDPLLIGAGFHTVLHEPLAESLLFNALHAACVLHKKMEGIVSIAQLHQRKQQGRAMNILLAEDNPVNQEVISEIIKRAGHRLTIASDGEQALDALSGDEDFDLVLLDMNMPEISGLDVLKQFRFMDTSADTPVIMLSADALETTVQSSLDAGANEYLTKPVSISVLLETLAKYANNDAKDNASKTENSTADDMTLLDIPMLEDLKMLLRSSEKLEDILITFEENGELLLAQIREHAMDNQTSQFCEAVHTLKGSSGTIGAQRLHAYCQRIEESKTQLSPARMQNMHEKLAQIFQASCLELRQFIQAL